MVNSDQGMESKLRFEHACNTERTDSLDSGISDMEYTTDIDGTMDCVKSSPNAVDPRLDEIKKIGRLLALDIVRYCSRTGKLLPETCHSKTLRRMVDRICERHQILFAGFLKKLNVESLFEARSSFTHIIDELYSDRQFNWGRIATTFAFAGSIAKQGVEQGMGSRFVDMIGEEVGSYVSSNLSVWILEQGGWDTMDKFFTEEEPVETKMWRGLLYTIVGLGALATTVAIIR